MSENWTCAHCGSYNHPRRHTCWQCTKAQNEQVLLPPTAENETKPWNPLLTNFTNFNETPGDKNSKQIEQASTHNTKVIGIVFVGGVILVGLAIVLLKAFKIDLLGSDLGRVITLIFFIVCATLLYSHAHYYRCPSCQRLWAGRVSRRSMSVPPGENVYAKNRGYLYRDPNPYKGYERPYVEIETLVTESLQCPYCGNSWTTSFITKHKEYHP